MLKSERFCVNLNTIRVLRLIKDAVDGKAIDACITRNDAVYEIYSKYKIRKEFKKSVNKTKKSEKK